MIILVLWISGCYFDNGVCVALHFQYHRVSWGTSSPPSQNAISLRGPQKTAIQVATSPDIHVVIFIEPESDHCLLLSQTD